MCGVGSLTAELLHRKPLFPGKDYIDQLKLIIRTLGTPSDAELAFISAPKARAYVKALAQVEVSAPGAGARKEGKAHVEYCNCCWELCYVCGRESGRITCHTEQQKDQPPLR